MSTATYAPPVVIDGPRPVAPRHNVFTVASLADPLDGDRFRAEQWIGGGQLYGYPPDPPFGFDPCSTGSSRQKDEGTEAPIPKFGTFTAYLAEACTMMGGAYDDFVRRLETTLEAVDAYAAEQQLMNGTYLTLNPYLADVNADLFLGNAAQAALTGLAYLENRIADTGRMGVIHATPATVISWALAVDEIDGVLRTKNGTPIVSGYGYVGVTKPESGSAPAAGQDWAYVSGPVVYRRGDTMPLGDDVASTLSRDLNDLVVRAERDLFIAWDTALQAAVLIDWSP